MGAWDIGIFDDDTAYDCLEEVILSEPLYYFKKSFQFAIDSNYLEYNDCHRVTVSAAIIDIMINHEYYEIDHDAWENWIDIHKEIKPYSIISLACQALQKVISQHSELNELWIENTLDYYRWKKNIEDLIFRLSNAQK